MLHYHRINSSFLQCLSPSALLQKGMISINLAHRERQNKVCGQSTTAYNARICWGQVVMSAALPAEKWPLQGSFYFLPAKDNAVYYLSALEMPGVCTIMKITV